MTTLKIGLTGGIGSGKSLVADYFSALGVVVIDADRIARKITEPNQPAFNTIVDHFGPKLVTPEGQLDRQGLRQCIFADPSERQWLEALLHPMIRQAIIQRVENIEAPYCLIVIPLLAESGGYAWLDRVIVVDAPEALQIKRTQARDHCTAADVNKILAAQASREARLAIASDVIDNDGDLDHLQKQVVALHHQILHT